jgi:V8-like Glu-specific endopeptidase
MLFESKSGEDQCEPSNFERHVLPLVGVVRCNWFNSQKRLATITYGTGVFISPRIILTCTHNVYSSSRNVVCDEVYFSPGIEKDSLTSNKIYQSKVKSHFKFK